MLYADVMCTCAYTYVVNLLVGEPLYAVHLPLHALPCHVALQAFHRMPQPRLHEFPHGYKSRSGTVIRPSGEWPIKPPPVWADPSIALTLLHG